MIVVISFLFPWALIYIQKIQVTELQRVNDMNIVHTFVWKVLLGLIPPSQTLSNDIVSVWALHCIRNLCDRIIHD